MLNSLRTRIELQSGYRPGGSRFSIEHAAHKSLELHKVISGVHEYVVQIGERSLQFTLHPLLVERGRQTSALAWVKSRIAKGTTVNADESSSWNDLQARFEMKRINHEEAYSLDGACTNQAEEFFSRLRRAEVGHHHHIAGTYLLRYAQESSWREDNRRVSNGEQARTVAHLAMKRGPSVDFSGYWQRHIKTA